MRNRIIKRVIEIGIVLIIIIFFILLNNCISKTKESSFLMREDSNKYAYQIEKLEDIGEKYIIRGWFFEINKSDENQERVLNNIKFDILLYDTRTELKRDLDGGIKEQKGITTVVTYNNRVDVNNYFSCKYNYSQCGFTAEVEKNSLEEDCIYQIIIKPNKDEEIGILTNSYIKNNILYHVNPNDIVDIEFKGSALQEVIEKGVCVVSNSYKKIYIFQYDWKLYWIADPDLGFNDNDTYIQYQLETTQGDKVPDSFRESKDKVNLGANFEQYEITNQYNCGKYRVSVREIPKDYSITCIYTGYYKEGEWKWFAFFRPQYYFK